ncbi:hypothetical protein [Okeania sp. SIO1I7]|uniref:hypothetical protein n=1 Tax=Okeania sp. SIO1I7 TaxID=2607772 RepID=UPI0013FBB738|nr:hypothetical protein [Okeania sp. SIO1I7]NET26098.1 hypothetical protein [Okeania sp. SIO1I7]
MTKGFQAKPRGREGVPGQLNLDLETYQEVYQVDPLGSWFGSKAAHTFITANGAAMMG